MNVAETVALSYWLLLWRAATAADLTSATEALRAGQPLAEFNARLLASADCRGAIGAIWDELDLGRSARPLEVALQGFGDDARFIDHAYQVVLGRNADDSGLAFYRQRLSEGLSRVSFARTLIRSDEFRARYEALCPQVGFVPRDTQLNELANPAKWANPDWMELLRSLVVVPSDRGSMHRKAYELTQLLFGLTRLGAVFESAQVLSVGAGHEPVLYWLANRVARVVAVDLYEGVWQAEGGREGDAVVLEDPSRYEPFAYRHNHLDFLRMDGTQLQFGDGTFDVVYSLSSIEHFGGLDGARKGVNEMVRVLKPAGVLALATEYCLSGPPHHEAFHPAEVKELLDHCDMELVAPIDELVWQRHAYKAVDLRTNRHQTPQLVVQDLGTEFTSVMAFLRKRDR